MEQKYTIELSHEEAQQLLTTIGMRRMSLVGNCGGYNRQVELGDSVTRKILAEMTDESAANV